MGNPFSEFVCRIPGAPFEDFPPKERIPVSEFRLKYMAREIFRKVDLAVHTERLTAEAVTRFHLTEDRVEGVNNTLKTLMRDAANPRVVHLLLEMGRKISHILGPRPCVDEFFASTGWGPGATSSLKAEDSTLDKKMLEPRLTVSPKARRYLVKALQLDYGWTRARLNAENSASHLSCEFESCDTGRFTTVPKSSTARRSIDIQPTGNLFLQKAVGKMIRRRLKRWGVDLDDQSRNQALAQRAFSDQLSTLDLSEASDSVSRELVRWVLPHEWFDLLDDLRTHSISINGSIRNLSKFSSMGNGFTFELESLIFFALLSVIKDQNADVQPISVYGDDLICGRKIAPVVISSLESIGFIVNKDKSFVDGDFFESCGKHYYLGCDVTPIYQKELPTDAPSWIRFHNRVFRWALRVHPSGDWFDSAVVPLLDLIRNRAETAHATGFIKKRRRIIPPLPLQPWWLEGDGGILCLQNPPSNVNGIAHIQAYRFVPKRKRGIEQALYAYSLRFRPEQSCLGLVTIRGRGFYEISKRRIYVLTHALPVVI